MNTVPSIGIIGAGFVGGATIQGFSGWVDIKVYDKYKKIGSMEEVVKQDIIFVCVPTPMKNKGACDTRIVAEVINNIYTELKKQDYEDLKPVVIRSTIPPDYLYNFDYCHLLNLMVMPEFLTERTANLDFINSTRFILGCNHNLQTTELVKKVFKHRFPNTRFIITSWETALLVKYGTNVFFTVKLSFFNELFRIAEAYGENGQEVINEILEDGRIGRSHFQIPGPDGKFGWGGNCFPKDNMAFSKIAREVDEESHMTDAARVVNNLVRGESNNDQ